MRILLFIILITFTVSAYPQDEKPKKIEMKIQVEGVCNMCKERIEEAAYIKGVKYAEWDKEKKELSLVYSPQKTSLEKIQKSLADAGHASKDMPANEEAYAKLPECCKYADGVKSH